MKRSQPARPEDYEEDYEWRMSRVERKWARAQVTWFPVEECLIWGTVRMRQCKPRKGPLMSVSRLGGRSFLTSDAQFISFRPVRSPCAVSDSILLFVFHASQYRCCGIFVHPGVVFGISYRTITLRIRECSDSRSLLPIAVQGRVLIIFALMARIDGPRLG